MTIRIAIIGAGRVGSFWIRAAIASGFDTFVWVRDLNTVPEDIRPRAKVLNENMDKASWTDLDAVVITARENAYGSIVEKIREAINLDDPSEGPVVAHVSGSIPAQALIDVGVPKSRALSAHPPYPFRTRAFSPGPKEVVHGLEGAPEAVTNFSKVVQEMGASWFELPAENRALYHLSCVFAANHVVTLTHVARVLAQRAVGDNPAAREAMTGLVMACVKNLSEVAHPQEALSGPVLRGHLPTLNLHQEQLKQTAPEYIALYRELVRATLPIIPQASADAVAPFLEPEELG